MKKNQTKTLIIVGTGQHSLVALDIVLYQKKFEQIYFLDRESEKNNSIKINKIKFKVLNYDDLSSFDIENCSYFIAIGNNQIRKNEYNNLKERHLNPINIISPNSVISPNVLLGKGNLINHGVIINHTCKLKNNSIINTNSSIDHNCNIGSHVHICPGVTCLGNVQIGDGSFIGAGANIDLNVHIGKNCFISPGSTLTRNLEDNKKIIFERKQIISSI